MTRVNLIDPSLLTNRHLIAEYKELSQLVGQVRVMIRNDSVWGRIPKVNSLGRGHVTFFVDKLDYIHRRWKKLKREMKFRGYRPKSVLYLDDLPDTCFGYYKPTTKALCTIRKRIKQRIAEKPHLYPDAKQLGWI